MTRTARSSSRKESAAPASNGKRSQEKSARSALDGWQSSTEAMLSELESSKSVAAEVIAIAAELVEKDGSLSAVDMAQLRDYARLADRVEKGTTLADSLIQDDPRLWAAITGKIQIDLVQKRGILRDLKGTRYTKAKGEPAKKTAEKLDTWAGTI